MRHRATWLIICGILCGAVFGVQAAPADDGDGWIQLWDGKTFKGWRANENKDSWKIADGTIVCHGPRSHLFYVGEHAPFKNFELKVDVMTTPGGNSGIYFHTRYQDQGWPKYGYEAQVNNSHRDPKRTGSLYAVKNVMQTYVKDNEWYTETVIVRGRRIIIKINDKVVVDYTEPEGKQPGKDFTRKLDQGTFALQAHDPDSLIYYKNIRVRKLP